MENSNLSCSVKKQRRPSTCFFCCCMSSLYDGEGIYFSKGYYFCSEHCSDCYDVMNGVKPLNTHLWDYKFDRERIIDISYPLSFNNLRLSYALYDLTRNYNCALLSYLFVNGRHCFTLSKKFN